MWSLGIRPINKHILLRLQLYKCKGGTLIPHRIYFFPCKTIHHSLQDKCIWLSDFWRLASSLHVSNQEKKANTLRFSILVFCSCCCFCIIEVYVKPGFLQYCQVNHSKQRHFSEITAEKLSFETSYAAWDILYT